MIAIKNAAPFKKLRTKKRIPLLEMRLSLKPAVVLTSFKLRTVPKSHIAPKKRADPTNTYRRFVIAFFN